MKKLSIWILSLLALVLIVTAVQVTTEYITSQEYNQRFTDSRIIQIYQDCNAEYDCMKQYSRTFECVEIIETDFDNKKITRMLCFE